MSRAYTEYIYEAIIDFFEAMMNLIFNARLRTSLEVHRERAQLCQPMTGLKLVHINCNQLLGSQTSGDGLYSQAA